MVLSKLENPIFARDGNQICRSAHHFRSHAIQVIANRDGGCTTIFTMEQKDGIYASTNIESSFCSEEVSTLVENYFRRFGRYICVHVKTTSAEPNKIVLRCHGFFRQVPVPCHLEHLKMRIDLTFILNERPTGETFNTFNINEEMTLDSYHSELHAQDAGIECCIGNEGFTECELLQGGTLLSSILSAPQNPSIVLNGILKVVFFCDDELQRKVKICKRISNRDVNSDFVIVAKNGAEISCHKIFLAGFDKVVAKNLNGNFKESMDNRLVWDHISAEGVIGLLDYAYAGDLKRPAGNSEIALELLQIGQMYDIPELEGRMKTMILQMRNEWFCEDVPLRLFSFAQHLENYEDIKEKAMSVLLARKANKALDCNDWQELTRDGLVQLVNYLVKGCKLGE